MDPRFERYTEILKTLCDTMSISGNTRAAAESLRPLFEGRFDSIVTDPVGNVILTKKCGAENAPRLLIDAHLDEVGMMVSGICDGGFLRVAAIGGIDTRILQAADVLVYGKEVIRGVVASTPPHLQDPGDADKLVKMKDLLIDTGYSKEELETLAPVGTPVGFASGLRPLAGKILSGRGLDDKCCAASALLALEETPRESLAFDVTLVLAAFEETAHIGGAAPAAYSVSPDLALALDVDFGSAPDDGDNKELLPLGDGLSVTFSSVTSRRFTKAFIRLCEEKKIKYQLCVSAGSLGTDGEVLSVSRGGTSCVNLGVPLRNMHTYTEVISGDDALALADGVAAVMTSRLMAEETSK